MQHSLVLARLRRDEMERTRITRAKVQPQAARQIRHSQRSLFENWRLSSRGKRKSSRRKLELRNQIIGTCGMVRSKGIVGLMEPLHRQPFLLFPIGLAMRAGTELPVRDFSVERESPLAIETPGVFRPRHRPHGTVGGTEILRSERLKGCLGIRLMFWPSSCPARAFPRLSLEPPSDAPAVVLDGTFNGRIVGT